MMKKCYSILLVVSCVLLVCSCESKREQKAIKICQESKIHLDNAFVSQFGGADNMLAKWLVKAEFSILGLDYEKSTWLDLANMNAEQNPNEKMRWVAKKTDIKNVYHVGFVNEDNWGYYWEVNIKEKIVLFLNMQDFLSREYGHSRLDANAPFEIVDISVDTLKMSSKGIYYSIKGNCVNHTGKSISDARLSACLSVVFENKTEEADNNYLKNGKILKNEVSESHPWKNDESIAFAVITEDIKQIYLDYDPQYVFFTIEMKASDPIGYSYDKAIYEVDMKDRWNSIRKLGMENNMDISAPKTSAATEKLLTQETEETATLRSSIVKTNTTKRNVATTTTQDVAEEQVVNKNALFPGKRNTNTSTGNGTGTSSGTGTGTGSGSGGGIGNGDFYLDGRPVVRKAFPKSKNNLEGVVKVEFSVDREGNVVYAKAGFEGTTITDSQVWEECETAARQSKFKAKSDAQTEEKGIITYRFILQ